uniref:Uncharacterized protein n=1 Tax=Rhizophora mucronata TaxID=61149 RepID=A0A2P2QCZ5_RHIMU
MAHSPAVAVIDCSDQLLKILPCNILLELSI